MSSGAFTLNRLKSDSHKFAPVAAEELLPARRSGCATGLVHNEGRARGVAAGHGLRKAHGGEFASEAWARRTLVPSLENLVDVGILVIGVVSIAGCSNRHEGRDDILINSLPSRLRSFSRRGGVAMRRDWFTARDGLAALLLVTD
ncbi:ARM repeat superfamily protein [Striga asiatica]|uniref:ARM repeat superfamily protein n=1 Tax=Striga asiatica TaxID=4170 RepID=A0A5A7PAX7_STRAF|nr:ARM repeat superfamily protein [Striga asiatica]